MTVLLSLLWEVVPFFFVMTICLRFVLVLSFKLKDCFRSGLLQWIELTCIAVLFGVLAGTNLDLMIRVRLSERVLHSHVEKMHCLPPRSLSMSHNAGLFTVHRTTVEDDVVWMTTVDFGRWWAAGGLVYSPHGAPPMRGESEYQHLYGPWWRWRWDW